MTFDPQKVAELRHVIQETPGEFSFWPTHFAGCIPFIEVYLPGTSPLRFQVCGITSNSRPSEGDYAIKYARRLAASANEMPALLDELERLQKENERLRKALHAIVEDGTSETPSQYFDHTYDECTGCQRKYELASAALKD